MGFRLLEFERLPPGEQLRRVEEFRARMLLRRSVREFSAEAVPFALIEAAVQVAAAAPSEASQQPWSGGRGGRTPELRAALSLEIEPWLIAVFRQDYEPTGDRKTKHLAALHMVIRPTARKCRRSRKSLWRMY